MKSFILFCGYSMCPSCISSITLTNTEFESFHIVTLMPGTLNLTISNGIAAVLFFGKNVKAMQKTSLFSEPMLRILCKFKYNATNDSFNHSY